MTMANKAQISLNKNQQVKLDKPAGFLHSISLFFQNIANLYTHFTALVGVEFELAVQTGISLLLMSLFSLIIIGSLWLCLSLTLAWFLWQQQLSIYMILSIEIAINSIMLLGMLLKISHNKKYLLFSNTRRQWNTITGQNGEKL